MRTAVYALAAFAAASGASAFMPQANFAGRAPALRARASVRPAATTGHRLFQGSCCAGLYHTIITLKAAVLVYTMLPL